MKTIIETASENPDFSTLVMAIKKAALVETLAGEGPFTVFAPNNQAFAKIPENTLSAVLADKEKLATILTYHVVAGKVMAKDIEQMTATKTIAGPELKIETHNHLSASETETPEVSEVHADSFKHIRINDASISARDIECSNGVIHVIDTVLMPQQ